MSYVDEVLEVVKKKNAYTERMRFLRESQSRIVRSCSVFLG